jgi:hypothetical protein
VVQPVMGSWVQEQGLSAETLVAEEAGEEILVATRLVALWEAGASQGAQASGKVGVLVPKRGWDWNWGCWHPA